MVNRWWKNACPKPQNARGDLTNRPKCYSLRAEQNIKANCARCVNTSHSSDPTLTVAVTGLLRIIQNCETPVLRGFSGPTDRVGSANARVRVGRFAILCTGRV